MQSILFSSLFFGFLLAGAFLEIARRKKHARKLAKNWLNNYNLLLLNESDMTVNSFVWPVRVNVIAQNGAGEKLCFTLKVGSFFGGHFGEVINCESTNKQSQRGQSN